MSDQIKRVVLAYSGGLDTSVILKWLQVTYNCELVTFTADLGQGEELEPARAKAKLMGVPDEHIYIDRETGADAVAHGATGKGNDQVRFELSAYALEPSIKVIAPWREWDLTSRSALIAFAEQNQIPIAKDKRGEAPFSIDANLLHVSSEGKVLEDPATEVPDYVYSRTLDPEDAPNQPEYVE